jgi:two-component system cell cycle sensor histidine kinase/response regulator CckA
MVLDPPGSHSSLDFFETFFALNPDLAAVTAPGGVFKRANPAWLKTLGYSPEELLDLPFTDFVHPDDLPATLDELAREFAGSETTGFINRYRCKDGSYKWIEWEAAPSSDNSLVFATGRDITERKRAEQKLEDQDRQLSTIYNSVSDALFLLTVEPDDRFRFLSVNKKFLELTGLEESQVVDRFVSDVIPEPSLGRVRDYYRQAIESGLAVSWEEISEYPAGVKFAEVSVNPIYDENGKCTNVVGAVRDLSERAQSILQRTRLEDQLRQAQKLESIGRLAGGVAHDFNNVLTIIRGYSEFLEESLSLADRRHQYAVQISSAGETGANLTRQLLAFSRKQVLQPKPLYLNSVVSEMRSMLQSLIGEDIRLVIKLGPRLGQVMADASQLRQVLMNLAANARDAMPHGGDLVIETSEVLIDEAHVVTHPEATRGLNVLLLVSDNGSGMDEETRQNVFDPFFTTKGPGEGTGLGLATVSGIIRQSQGWIELESAPGHGATFKLYLPRLEGEFIPEPVAAPSTEVRMGAETILLVEDDNPVRHLLTEILTLHGYSVINAANGEAALALARAHEGAIQLMVSDVVMPGMSGRELANRMKAARPELKVLFISGYTADAIVHRGVTDHDSEVLPKPFTPAVLIGKVREILAAVCESGMHARG